jgi:hypothetical protein
VIPLLPWNRKEVFVGTSLQDFYKARETLSQNHIEYAHRMVDRNMWRQNYGRSPLLTRFASFPENLESDCMYYIYVDHKDYEMACFLLRK